MTQDLVGKRVRLKDVPAIPKRIVGRSARVTEARGEFFIVAYECVILLRAEEFDILPDEPEAKT
jgi:hypothetical protein